MRKVFTESEVEYCGCCCHYHRIDYYGDCRNDKERLVEADTDKVGNPLFVATVDFDFSTQTIKA